ncbi:hypothetical protein DEF24_21260, partial [Marinitenerispora sediminis]
MRVTCRPVKLRCRRQVTWLTADRCREHGAFPQSGTSFGRFGHVHHSGHVSPVAQCAHGSGVTGRCGRGHAGASWSVGARCTVWWYEWTARWTWTCIGGDRVATDGENGAGVRSVLRALDLLALFDDRHQHRTIRELTEHSGLAKSTVLRLVGTLEQRGLLWSRPDGRIGVGPGLLRWAGLARTAWQVPDEVRQIMRELVAETAETANLYVRSDVARVCVAQEEGPQNLRHVLNVGDELPLWAGAAGRALLLGADDALLRRVAAASPQGARPE